MKDKMFLVKKLFTVLIFMMILNSGLSYSNTDREKLYEKYPDLEKLVDIRSALNEKYFGIEHYIDTMLMGLFTKEHVYVYGSAGGCKTATCRDLLTKVGGVRVYDKIFTPATRPEELTGMPIPKKVYEDGEMIYNIKDAMANYDIGLVDEATNAPPEALAALFAAMNERIVLLPNKKVEGILKSLVFTSNSTPSDVIKDFERSNKKRTGDAFFDRILFKVFLPGKSADDEVRYNIISMGTGIKPESDLDSLPPFSLEMIYKLIDQDDMFEWPESIRLGILNITKVFDQNCVIKAKEESAMYREDPASCPFPYRPTALGSSRDLGKIGKVIRAGILLSFIKGERDNLNIKLDDLRFLKYLLTTTSESNESLFALKEYYYEESDLKTIDDVMFENSEFDRVLTGYIKTVAPEISEAIALKLNENLDE